MVKQKIQRAEETAVVHVTQLLAEKQVGLEHNTGRKKPKIIQNTEFAMAFSTDYLAFMWPVNPHMALSEVQLLQVSMHKKMTSAYMPVYTRIISNTAMGTSNLKATNDYLDSQGIKCAAFV